MSREAPRVRLEQAGERQPCVRATQKRHPLHNNLCIVCLPGARQLSKKGCSREAEGMGGADCRREGLVPDVLEQLEGCWGEAAVRVQDEGQKGAAPLL